MSQTDTLCLIAHVTSPVLNCSCRPCYQATKQMLPPYRIPKAFSLPAITPKSNDRANGATLRVQPR